jgi:hypothetical protein
MKSITEESLPDGHKILYRIEKLLGQSLEDEDDSVLVYLIMVYKKGFKDGEVGLRETHLESLFLSGR